MTMNSILSFVKEFEMFSLAYVSQNRRDFIARKCSSYQPVYWTSSDQPTTLLPLLSLLGNGPVAFDICASSQRRNGPVVFAHNVHLFQRTMLTRHVANGRKKVSNVVLREDLF